MAFCAQKHRVGGGGRMEGHVGGRAPWHQAPGVLGDSGQPTGMLAAVRQIPRTQGTGHGGKETAGTETDRGQGN